MLGQGRMVLLGLASVFDNANHDVLRGFPIVMRSQDCFVLWTPVNSGFVRREILTDTATGAFISGQGIDE